MKQIEKPIEPAPNECCESGCDPCIWDIYRKELRKWEKWQAAQQQSAEQNLIPTAQSGQFKKRGFV